MALDTEKLQKAIAGIEAKQSELSNDEQQAFQTLKTLFATGNFSAAESSDSIQVLKSNLPKHSKNRLLLVYLKNFVEISEQCFKSVSTATSPVFAATEAPEVNVPSSVDTQKITPPAPPKSEPTVVTPPTITPPQPKKQATIPADSASEDSNYKTKGSNLSLILIIIAIVLLIGGWQIYKHWDSMVKPMLEDWGLIEKTIPVTAINFDKKDLEIFVGDTVRIIPDIIPHDATDKSITWLSDDTAVAIVDSTGLVTAVAAGVANITAFCNDSISDTCKVIVHDTLLLEDTANSTDRIFPQSESAEEVPIRPNTSTISQPPTTGNNTATSSPPSLSPAQSVQPAYTASQLNNLLNNIANGNDAARDKMRKLNHVTVQGASNISDVQQLITDVSNGGSYTITDVQTDEKGKVVSITVRK